MNDDEEMPDEFTAAMARAAESQRMMAEAQNRQAAAQEQHNATHAVDYRKDALNFSVAFHQVLAQHGGSYTVSDVIVGAERFHTFLVMGMGDDA